MYGAIYKYCIRPNDLKFQEIMSLRNIETLKNCVFLFKKSMTLSALHDSLFHVCIYVCIGVIYTLLPFSLLFFFFFFFVCTHPHLIVILFVWNNYVLYIVYHFCVWFEKINKLEAWFWCCKKKNTNQNVFKKKICDVLSTFMKYFHQNKGSFSHL